MVLRILHHLDDFLPFALSVVTLAALVPAVDLDRDLLARAAVAALGSAFAAYGLREVLRAWGGGYYCCNHGFYATLGLAITAVGWVFLVGALRGPILASD